MDQMTDLKSMHSKASFVFHPKKIDHDFTPSPIARMPDEDIMSAVNKANDEGFSLGMRVNRV